jgi:hypothetical protein
MSKTLEAAVRGTPTVELFERTAAAAGESAANEMLGLLLAIARSEVVDGRKPEGGTR